MLKNWKSAVMWGVILWVLIFVAFSVIMFAPALKGNIPMQTALELVVLPVLVIFASYMFFKNEKATLKDGFVLGVYFLVIGTILDLLITIPLFVVPSGMSYASFYSQWNMWFGFLETVLFSALVGYYMGKKKSE